MILLGRSVYKFLHKAYKIPALTENMIRFTSYFSERNDYFAFSLFILYTIFFTILTIRMYDTYYFFDFDLAVNNQVLWTTIHGHPFYTSIFGYNLFGDHVSPIFLLILPFYAIIPDARLLLFFQSLFLGMGVIPLYLLAKRELGSSYGVIVSLIYILFPALAFANLFEFHPIALSTSLLLFTFLFMNERRFTAFVIFLSFSLFTREDMALVVIMFGVYALIRKMGSKWVIFPIALGVIWALITVGIIMPTLAPIGFLHYERYTHLGINSKEIILTIIQRPLYVLSYMFSPEKVRYLIELLSSLAFLPLMSPLEMIMTIPVFGLNLLSSWGSQQTLAYHYNVQIIPFLFIASIFSLKRLKDAFEKTSLKRWWRVWIILIVTFSIGSCAILSPLPQVLSTPSYYISDQKDVARQKMIDLIPPEASVMATFNFLPRLSHRMDVYSYHHWYMRGYIDRFHGNLDMVEYILMDFDDYYMNNSFRSIEGDMRQKGLLRDPSWSIVALSQKMVLLKRNYRSAYSFVDVYKMLMDDEVGKANFEAAQWMSKNLGENEMIYAAIANSYVQLHYVSEISERNFLNISSDNSILNEFANIELPETFGKDAFIQILKKYDTSYIYISHKFFKSEFMMMGGTGELTTYSKPDIIASQSDIFELVYENSFVRIYRINYPKAFKSHDLV
jgi:uncharacterized membrane protein